MNDSDIGEIWGMQDSISDALLSGMESQVAACCIS